MENLLRFSLKTGLLFLLKKEFYKKFLFKNIQEVLLGNGMIKI